MKSWLGKVAPAGVQRLGRSVARFAEHSEARLDLGKQCHPIGWNPLPRHLGLGIGCLRCASCATQSLCGSYATGAAVRSGRVDEDGESVCSGGERQFVDEDRDEVQAWSLPGAQQGVGAPKVAKGESMLLKIEYLRGLGLKETSLKKLVRQSEQSQRPPLVLRTSVKKLREVAAFLTEEVGLTRAEAAKSLFMSVGSCSVDQCLRPKVEYFQQLGFSMEQIRQIVCLRPVALKPSRSRIDDIVGFLQGLAPVDVRTVVKSHPQILSNSLEGSIGPAIKFFKDELKFTELQLTRVFKWPNICTFSVEKNLRLKSEYFRGLGLSNQDIARMVSCSPTIFALNMESSIKPKVDYLLRVLKKDISELVPFPGYLTYSLSGRIQPRYEYAIAAGSDFYSLSFFLSPPEDRFKKRCASRALKLLREGKAETE